MERNSNALHGCADGQATKRRTVRGLMAISTLSYSFLFAFALSVGLYINKTIWRVKRVIQQNKIRSIDISKTRVSSFWLTGREVKKTEHAWEAFVELPAVYGTSSIHTQRGTPSSSVKRKNMGGWI